MVHKYKVVATYTPTAKPISEGAPEDEYCPNFEVTHDWELIDDTEARSYDSDLGVPKLTTYTFAGDDSPAQIIELLQGTLEAGVKAGFVEAGFKVELFEFREELELETGAASAVSAQGPTGPTSAGPSFSASATAAAAAKKKKKWMGLF